MVRISITAAAYEAIATMLASGIVVMSARGPLRADISSGSTIAWSTT
jgi:hypothetical protein